MKKNRMMRLASGLLVLVILTTCIISGTFAKYATGDNAKDSARAAKWGVTTTISGALFGKHYNAFSETEGMENLGSNQIAAAYTGSVDHASGEADDGKNIVAPGTKSENMTISIAGKPEVSGKIEFTVDDKDKENFSDIWLASGKYGVMTDVTDTIKTVDDIAGLFVKQGTGYVSATAADYENAETKYYELRDVVTLSKATYKTNEDVPRFIANKYYPIIWTFSNSKAAGGTGDAVDAGEAVLRVRELKDQIAGIVGDNAAFDSNTDLGEQVGNTTINWKWPFEALNVAGTRVSPVVDGCDTILGDLIAWKTDGTSNYQVVQIGDTDTAPTYTGVTKTVESSGVTYAKAGETQVACLTVGFNLKVVVSQTD